MSSCWRALLLLTLLGPLACTAHEVRPAYLELREVQPGELAVLWKTPMRGDLRLALAPELSGPVETLTPITTRESGGASVQRWRLKTEQPLRGQSLRIQGLEATLTDVLVRVEFADGATWLRRLTPQEPAATIPASQSVWFVAGEYLELGIEHILFGIDHLLFVFALLLITHGGWKLVKTVTAFTVAHSITLALATLGFVHVPQAPVEAVIALSIVFVAAQILRINAPSPLAGEGRGEGGSLTARAPWVVAFIFGLLHGFGFAGALAEVGLPEGNIPLALLFFNIGVELGQLLFVAAVLSLLVVIQRIRFVFPRWSQLVPPYAIGSVATFWVIQRVAGF